VSAPLFTDADLSDESASAAVESLPGYSSNDSGVPRDDDNGADDQSVPGAGLNDPVPGTGSDGPLADITTAADSGQMQGVSTANTALPGDLTQSLRDAVAAADRQAQQSTFAEPSQPAGFNPLASKPAGFNPLATQQEQLQQPW
jgi:hypothetical protein